MNLLGDQVTPGGFVCIMLVGGLTVITKIKSHTFGKVVLEKPVGMEMDHTGKIRFFPMFAHSTETPYVEIFPAGICGAYSPEENLLSTYKKMIGDTMVSSPQPRKLIV